MTVLCIATKVIDWWTYIGYILWNVSDPLQLFIKNQSSTSLVEKEK